jgi:alginate O-acetyltransferase complex protein AlgI
MVASSLSYALFVALLFIAYWFLVPVSLRGGLFLASSLGLLIYLFPAHTLLLLVVSSGVYLAGEFISSGKSIGNKGVFLFTVLGILGILVYYKYLPLIAQTVNYINLFVSGSVRLEVPEQLIPIGLSFFTFRFIHYIVEVKRGNIYQIGYCQFLLYTFFFPIIMAGPIERYDRFESQRKSIKNFKWEYLTEGLSRILLGLFKKIVIADSLSSLSVGLSNPDLGALDYLVAVYAFAFKIYFDFSGYSDIAIGTGRLFGYRIMENFNAPYLQRNISLFWKSWHMSLTGWFRDYLFIPLGGSRGTLARTICNTLIVMAATGLWHGAAWHFMAWGLYHAAGLIIFRLYRLYIIVHLSGRLENSRALMAISTALTFNFTAFGWIFFVNGIGQSLHIFKVIIQMIWKGMSL